MGRLTCKRGRGALVTGSRAASGRCCADLLSIRDRPFDTCNEPDRLRARRRWGRTGWREIDVPQPYRVHRRRPFQWLRLYERREGAEAGALAPPAAAS